MNTSGGNFTRFGLTLVALSIFALAAIVAITRPDSSGSTVVADTSTAPSSEGFYSVGIYAQIDVDGTVLDGHTTMNEIGGVDVSAEHIELIWASMAGSVGGTETGTNRASGRLALEPFTIVKSIDGTSPQLLQAMIENKNITVTVKLFGTDPESGSPQHEYNYVLENARIVSIRTSSGKNSSNNAGEFSQTETIGIAYSRLRVEHLIESTEFEFDWQTAV